MTAKYRPFTAVGTPAQIEAELALHMDPIADAPTRDPLRHVHTFNAAYNEAAGVTGAHVGQLAEYPGPFGFSRVQVRGLFETAEAAAVAVARYVQKWPPMGYGTSLTVREIAPDAWAVQGARSNSCD